jgi:phage-related minor tail protein
VIVEGVKSMAETPDAVMPVLRKIQDELSAIRKEQQASKDRDINMTDAIMEAQSEIIAMRKDNLMHLGLTTKHRLAAEALEDKVEDLSARVVTLEARL